MAYNDDDVRFRTMTHTHDEALGRIDERIAKKQRLLKITKEYKSVDDGSSEGSLSHWDADIKELEEDVASLLANRAVLSCSITETRIASKAYVSGAEDVLQFLRNKVLEQIKKGM